MNNTLHIIWGRDAVSRYRLGVIDNIVRVAFSVYDFMHPKEAQAFLRGVGEARDPDDWLLVTNILDVKKLGKPLRARLIEAAKQGDVSAVRALLETGVNMDAKDEVGLNALHWAAKNGHHEVAETLLEAGAEPDAPAENGTMQTPLHIACESHEKGTARVVAVLVAHGAGVEQADHLGNRPLHSLVGGRDGQLESAGAKMRTLLEEGRADPRNENARGEKPLNSPVGAAAGAAALLTTMMHMLNEAEHRFELEEIRRSDVIKSMRGGVPRMRPEPL